MKNIKKYNDFKLIKENNETLEDGDKVKFEYNYLGTIVDIYGTVVGFKDQYVKVEYPAFGDEDGRLVITQALPTDLEKIN